MTPTAIENRTGSGILALAWDDGSTQELTHRQLRAACPCAGCRSARQAGSPVAAGADVRLAAIEPAGLNALNLVFSDGHGRGIYPFSLLAALGAAAP